MKKQVFIILLSFFAVDAAAQGNQLPPTPANLRAELIAKSGRQYIRLSWDSRNVNDTLTAGYYVYNNFPPEEKIYRNGEINLLDQNTVDYEVKSLYSVEYKFAVTAVTAYPDQNESPQGNIVSVVTTSLKLPPVQVKNASMNGKTITVDWDYASIADVTGFHVYVNKRKVTDSPVKEKSYMFSFQEEKLKKCMIQVKAISASGIESDFNVPVYVPL